MSPEADRPVSNIMSTLAIGARFEKLRRYVDFTSDDEARVRALAPTIAPHVGELVDDFYAEILRHPETSRIIVGGAAQVARLKATLCQWLAEMFAGPFDDDYAVRRWRVGRRHVEIGLPQIFVNAAHARLRWGIERIAWESHPLRGDGFPLSLQSLHKTLDLDLALIQDAYEQELIAQREELARRRNDAAFRNLVESADCSIVLLATDRTVLFVNGFVAKLTGWSRDERKKRTAAELCVSEDREAFENAVAQAASGTVVKGLESRLPGVDGQRRHLLWNICLFEHFELGTVVLCVGHDVTSFVEAQAKQFRAERLATIGRLSAGLAHEARNALQRIQACSEMLEFEVQDKAEAVDLVRRIQSAQDQMHRLLDEVRGYAGEIRLDRAPCRIQDVCHEAWEALAVARRGRAAKLSFAPHGLELSPPVDRFRMIQVFRNLFENSLAACCDPVEVTVDVTPVGSGAPERAVCVQVCDNGPGLDAEQRRKIFEPFFTTKTKGTGLGMAIAQRIVEAHGGKIEAVERPPPGAEIRIVLPWEASL